MLCTFLHFLVTCHISLRSRENFRKNAKKLFNQKSVDIETTDIPDKKNHKFLLRGRKNCESACSGEVCSALCSDCKEKCLDFPNGIKTTPIDFLPLAKKCFCNKKSPVGATEMLFKGVIPINKWEAFQKNLIKNIISLNEVRLHSKRRVSIIDLGARVYESSVKWFVEKYPRNNLPLNVYAFEVDSTWMKSYKGKNVTVINRGAWVNEDGLDVYLNKKKWGTPLQYVPKDTQKSMKSSNIFSNFHIPTLDFADWLKNNINQDDFVVLKMDIDNGEYWLLPHLIRTGVICSIDEIFLELHPSSYEGWYGGKKDEAWEIFPLLQSCGISMHQWI